MKRRLFILGVVAALVPVGLIAGFFAVVYFSFDPLHFANTSSEATVARIYAARHVVADYYAAHEKLPPDVGALLKGHRHELDTDSLNRPFLIRVREDGVTVEIGTSGGRDIRGVFRADLPTGKAIEQLGPWVEDPLDNVKPWSP